MERMSFLVRDTWQFLLYFQFENGLIALFEYQDSRFLWEEHERNMSVSHASSPLCRHERQMKKTHLPLTVLSFPRDRIEASKADTSEME